MLCQNCYSQVKTILWQFIGGGCVSIFCCKQPIAAAIIRLTWLIQAMPDAVRICHTLTELETLKRSGISLSCLFFNPAMDMRRAFREKKQKKWRNEEEK